VNMIFKEVLVVFIGLAFVEAQTGILSGRTDAVVRNVCYFLIFSSLLLHSRT
jgi:hypothetical protein